MDETLIMIFFSGLMVNLPFSFHVKVEYISTLLCR